MSKIASANGNSSTTSPSSSVTSMTADSRAALAPSVRNSSRIMSRATSQARSGLRNNSPSVSATNSSPIRVLKKYRGMGHSNGVAHEGLKAVPISQLLYPAGLHHKLPEDQDGVAKGSVTNSLF